MSKDIAVVLGARTDAVKLAGVITQLGDRARTIALQSPDDPPHSSDRSEAFELDTPTAVPDISLNGVDPRDPCSEIATTMNTLSAEFAADRPAAVIVHGDGNRASAGAQAAKYAGIPVVHVGAGVRSHDRRAPEDLNRIITAALADVHCAATLHNVDNLTAEGVDSQHVAVTGNTVVETTLTALEHGDGLLGTYFADGVAPAEYVIAAISADENIGTKHALRRVLTGLVGIHAPVVLIRHASTLEAIERFGLLPYLDAFISIAPPKHSDFLDLALRARLLITDSGDIQEECTVLKRPVLVIREHAERPESVEAGFAQVAPPPRDIAAVANVMLANPSAEAILERTPSPYGDGSASLQIALIASRIADGATATEAITGVMSTSIV